MDIDSIGCEASESILDKRRWRPVHESLTKIACLWKYNWIERRPDIRASSVFSLDPVSNGADLGVARVAVRRRCHDRSRKGSDERTVRLEERMGYEGAKR